MALGPPCSVLPHDRSAPRLFPSFSYDFFPLFLPRRHLNDWASLIISYPTPLLWGVGLLLVCNRRGVSPSPPSPLLTGSASLDRESGRGRILTFLLYPCMPCSSWFVLRALRQYLPPDDLPFRLQFLASTFSLFNCSRPFSSTSSFFCLRRLLSKGGGEIVPTLAAPRAPLLSSTNHTPNVLQVFSRSYGNFPPTFTRLASLRCESRLRLFHLR